MSEKLKISDIDQSVRFVDFENLLDIYVDSRDNYMFNLNSTVYLEGLKCKMYKPSHDMFWTTLSYELYKTTRLWWVLMKINDVGMDRCMEPVRAAEEVKCLEDSEMQALLNRIAQEER